MQRSVAGEQLAARITYSHGRFRRMKTKGSPVGSEFGEFVTDHQDLVGPPNRSRRQAPDVGRVVKCDRCAKEDVLTHDVDGDACSMDQAIIFFSLVF